MLHLPATASPQLPPRSAAGTVECAVTSSASPAHPSLSPQSPPVVADLGELSGPPVFLGTSAEDSFWAWRRPVSGGPSTTFCVATTDSSWVSVPLSSAVFRANATFDNGSSLFDGGPLYLVEFRFRALTHPASMSNPDQLPENVALAAARLADPGARFELGSPHHRRLYQLRRLLTRLADVHYRHNGHHALRQEICPGEGCDRFSGEQALRATVTDVFDWSVSQLDAALRAHRADLSPAQVWEVATLIGSAL